jgi:toxin HigB-1
MSYEIRITDDYLKKVIKFIRRHKDMASRYDKTLRILRENPYHPSLRLHKLSGELNEYYSVSINIEYRIIMDFIVVDKIIIPINIGTHDEVY